MATPSASLSNDSPDQHSIQLARTEMPITAASSSLLNSNPSLPTSPLPPVDSTGSASTIASGGGGASMIIKNSNAGVTTPTPTSVASGGGESSPGDFKPPPPSETQVLDRKRLQELVKEVDPNEQLDEDVEDLLLHIADDFIEQTVSATCALARHRKAPTVEVKDVQFILERNWNMWLPGFGTDEVRSYKKSATTEAHRLRMGLIKKALKKY